MKSKKLFLLFAAAAFFMAANAQGYYIEFKMSSIGKQSISGDMKAYHQNGSTRSEIKMNIPNMPNGGMSLISIIQKENPNKVFMLNEKEKTYSETDVSSNEDYKEHQPAEYEITVVGKEPVNGYNAVHVKVKRKGSSNEQEFWMTKDLKDFSGFQKIKTKYTEGNLFAALEAKGAGGFPVRIKAEERGGGIQFDLTKAEVKNNPASLFSLDGYKKGAAQLDPAQLQNMTPEQRQKMMEELIKQYGTEHH